MTPVQASAGNMDTHSSLLKWVQGVATPGASPVKSTRDLESKCLKKERCALVMKAGPLEVCLGAGDDSDRREASWQVVGVPLSGALSLGSACFCWHAPSEYHFLSCPCCCCQEWSVSTSICRAAKAGGGTAFSKQRSGSSPYTRITRRGVVFRAGARARLLTRTSRPCSTKRPADHKISCFFS